jgi:hypothetical protein
MALRFMGAIHRFVLEGRSLALARFYPSVGGPGGSANDRWEAFSATVEEHTPELRELVRPVQTNEVGRCSALLGRSCSRPNERDVPCDSWRWEPAPV